MLITLGSAKGAAEIGSRNGQGDGTLWADPALRDAEVGRPAIALQMQAVALRRLRLLHQVRTLNDLRLPPGNRLEALKGDRRGQQSIRIDQ